MARIIHAEELTSIKDNIVNANAKHVADGAGSVLKGYLNQEGINMPNLIVAMTTALGHEVNRKAQVLAAEKMKAQRDLKFEPAWKQYKGCVQFLKAFYVSNVTMLTDWGVNMNGNRVAHPSGFVARKDVWDALVARHGAMGAGSPLGVYLTQENIVLASVDASVQASVTDNQNFGKAQGQAKNYKQLRDVAAKPVKAALVKVGGFLMKLMKSNQMGVSAWGFVVDDSPKAPKKRKSILKLGQGITIENCKIGGVMENVGEVTLRVYVGKKTTGSFTDLAPGDMKGIEVGMSSMTVVNTSTLESGKFTVLVTG